MYWSSRFVPDEGNESIIDCWDLEGSLKVGDQLKFCNPDQGTESLGTVEVKKTQQSE